MVQDLGLEQRRHDIGGLLSLEQPATGLLGTTLSMAIAPASIAAAAGEASAGPLGGLPKRLTDIVIASVCLLLAAPLLILIAILIKATDRGPIFFAHTRVGFNGAAFRCYKVRTMAVDAEAILADHLMQNPDARAEWKRTQKLRHDPRVTALGTVLRTASLDELPQFFNVLRGDMSCVGPRPVTREELARYGPAVGDYLRTRPGLTGLWQVNGRSSAAYEARVQLDTRYVRTWSLWSDFLILCRTPAAMTKFSEVC